jgi:hypothetical protein
MSVRFVPADPAPASAENTTYFVFVTFDQGFEEFAGVIAQNGCGWSYWMDGEEITDTYVDRCELFQQVMEDPCTYG